MKKIKIQRLWLTVAVVHWLLSLLTDSLIITCENKLVYGVWKIVFLVFVLGFYQVVGYVVQRFAAKDPAVRKIVWLAGIYFLIMLCFLLLTWPGIWRIDEFTILRTARNLHIHYWQGYLTSVYYILCLMMLPVPVSVILFMCLINSAIVGYLVYKLWIYTGKKRLAYALYLPFFFFPVIDSNLYPMRMSIYAFLELLLLAKICFWVYEKRMPAKGEFAWTALLAGIVTAWRSESIYYLLLFPVLLVVFFWKQVSKKVLRKAILWYLLCALFLVGFQKIGEGGIGGSDGYEITAMIRPLTPLLVDAAYAEEKDLIAACDKVLNCAYMFQGASEGENGIGIFWRWAGEGLVRDTYNREEYRAFKQAYYELILRHPKTFLRERLDTYFLSTELLGRITDGEPPMPTLNQNLRYYVYALLECRSFEDFYTQRKVGVIVYSTIPPSLVLAVAVLWFLMKKKWVYAGCGALVALKVPLVFLTAPGTLFMYYYSPYLCGWILLFFVGILWIRKRNGSREAAK